MNNEQRIIASEMIDAIKKKRNSRMLLFVTLQKDIIKFI